MTTKGRRSTKVLYKKRKLTTVCLCEASNEKEPEYEKGGRKKVRKRSLNLKLKKILHESRGCDLF